MSKSRHLGLEDDLQRLHHCRQKAQSQRCASLVNLDFQPVCNCGFDGEVSPIQESIAEFEGARDTIEKATAHFFRTRVGQI